MKLDGPAPQVIRHRAGQARPEALVDDRYSEAGYLKDSHDLVIQGKVIGPGFGEVRAHAHGPDGALWVMSDMRVGRVGEDGLKVVGQTRFPDTFHGLLLHDGQLHCGRGRELQSYSAEGELKAALPLGFRVSTLHPGGPGTLVAESIYLDNGLAVIRDGQVLAEGKDVIGRSFKQGPQGQLQWLEKGQLARWSPARGLQRLPIAERPAEFWNRPEGGFVVQHRSEYTSNKGDTLAVYDEQGGRQGKFSLGGYVRELELTPGGVEVQTDNRREKLDLTKGWMAHLAGWDRTELPYRPREHERQVSPLPGFSWGEKTIRPHAIRFEPEKGTLQLRCAPLFHQFVAGGSLQGPLGSCLVAATDRGTLITGSGDGLRAYQLGSPVVAVEEAGDAAFRVRLDNGDRVEVRPSEQPDALPH